MARAEQTGKGSLQERDRAWQRRSDVNEGRLRQRSPLDLANGRHLGGAVHSGSDTPLVSMMKAAEPGQRDDHGILGGLGLDEPAGGCLLSEIVMGPVVVVVGEVFLQDALQMGLSQDDHVVEALSSDGSNDTFDVGTLPWAPWRDQELVNAHTFDPFLEDIAIDAVPVSQQVLRRSIPRESLDDCCAVHSAVGLVVTLKYRTRLRS